MNRIVILEDNPKQASNLAQHIQAFNSEFDIQSYCDTNDFYTDFETFKNYTIFFIDIVLPNDDGINIAKKIRDSIKGAFIIFVTSHIDKASEIYDVDHGYFIYKPDLEKRLPHALEKACEAVKKAKNSIIILSKGKMIVLSLNEIIYFERDLRKTLIHLEDKIIKSYDDFKSYHDQTTNNFHECHRSFIVNFDYVREHHRNHFVMCDGTIIPISRSHEKDTKEAFEKYILCKL